MIPLKKEEYDIVTEPLKKVPLNTLFARSVIENHVSGSVYVDNVDNPKTFCIVHPYGMSLLFGDFNNGNFNAKFRDYALNVNKVREGHEWMQVFPRDWDNVLNELFDGKILKSSSNVENLEDIVEINTRINLKFNSSKYKPKKINSGIKIIRSDEEVFNNLKGEVVPSYFWNNAHDFLENGVGFSLYYNGNLASTAYSAFVNDSKIEIGIETASEFRGRGFAHHVSSALIDYCLENDLEPVWSCRLENKGSYNLAKKLGFEPVLRTPYYRLSK